MLSTFPTLLPFLLFAFVASITPGPTNILVLSNSARFGFRAAAPIILGACVGAATIVFVVGSGGNRIFAVFPFAQTLLQWIGVLWLSCLSWQLFKACASEPIATDQEPRLGAIGAMALQVVNPKTWMMALAVVSVFAGNDIDRQTHVWVLSLAFFLIALPSLATWAVLGVVSSRLYSSPRTAGRINKIMAVLLLCSTWVTLFL
ncbi:LysE family translocator [Pseudomonas nunensis]|uniref:LysE family translocator n=1 Tax=Pseudomonas nunensis TaxID=2961896 RepID=A0ABY5EQ24_9PSED|nr:LysE family translocator [Pseudomonas nunensis]KOY00895.1 lysine transporter LysE [Pseudomonas nunensis]KPN90461.1 lysine transporter LysE [Pseudomonas nunensis]MCL5225534.1 LysE family translocator [Pseudomonas nunensis]UTO17824.1 LysE family translocator [Pseudomonas nunensis]